MNFQLPEFCSQSCWLGNSGSWKSARLKSRRGWRPPLLWTKLSVLPTHPPNYPPPLDKRGPDNVRLCTPQRFSPSDGVDDNDRRCYPHSNWRSNFGVSTDRAVSVSVSGRANGGVRGGKKRHFLGSRVSKSFRKSVREAETSGGEQGGKVSQERCLISDLAG